MVYIYSLSDPRTTEIQYIGRTTNLKRRYYQYTEPSGWDTSNTDVMQWCRKLHEEGIKPIMEIVDNVEKEGWQFWEIYWIAQFKAWGFCLKNIAIGGGGSYGYKWSEEARKKRSIESKGKNTWSKGKKRDPAVMEKLWQGNRGKKMKQEEKQHLLGNKHSARAVLQICPKTKEIIEEYESVLAASKAVGPHSSNIIACIKGKLKKSYGYEWRYKQEKFL